MRQRVMQHGDAGSAFCHVLAEMTPEQARAGLAVADGLAVTYFRVRKRHTIIGANPFHGPVRDGKAWFQAAVAAR